MTPHLPPRERPHLFNRRFELVLVVLACTAPGCPESPPPTQPPSSSPGNAQASAASAENDRDQKGRDQQPALTRYADVTTRSAIEFTYRNGEEAGHYAILESLGGGAALCDFNSDGRLDVFLPGGGRFESGPVVRGLPSALYRQSGAWEFTDVTTPSRTGPAPFYSHGAAAADYDNDGFCDVLVTGYGGLLLWHNQGDGTFAEIAASSGLTDTLWSSSAAWGDVDGDGSLDLYVAHYVNWSFENNPICQGPQPVEREICPPRRFDPLPDVFYFNSGEGTFRDGTADVGLRPDGKGLGVVMADLDLDGRIDIYVGNDTVPNFLYRNQGEGKLSEAGLTSGTSLSERGTPDGSMGVDVGDYNLDGRPDIWVANYENESFALYRNEGRWFFQHVSQPMGVTALGALYVGWGTVFLDFDRDGDEDLAGSNGHVIRHPVNAPLRQAPLLLENQQGRRFANAAAGAGDYFQQPHMGRGLAVGDVDNDGDSDLLIVHTNEPVALLSNESPNSHHWFGLRLLGTRGNRSAIGAWVIATTADGRQLMRQVKGGGSYASTSDRRLFFGLGTDSAVASVEIHWPSGVLQTLPAPAIDRYTDVIEPPSTPEAP